MAVAILDDYPQGNESIFHNYIKENPILLDVYVDPKNVFSKPEFYCPPGELLNGKKYVEPDFVIRYPGNRYKLIELEKPGKNVLTRKGHTTSEANQATYQTGEWDTYILSYYYCIKDKFPNLQNDRSYMVVIGRRSDKTDESLEIIRHQFKADVCFYDELLDRAKQAHATLAALSI